MRNQTVAVLRGGPSAAYETSMQTGYGVLSALQRRGYATRDIIVTRGSEWLVDGFVKTPDRALIGIDVVFIAIRGAYGEDGTVQRILDRLAIPYTGSQAYPSSIAIHKQLTKDHVAALGIKTARSMRLRRDHVADSAVTAETIRNLFGPEYIIKPVTGDSSIGAILVDTQSSLSRAIEAAFATAEDILVEERIKGIEATVGILERYRDQQHYDLPATEIVLPTHATFFDHTCKTTGGADTVCPGRFSRTIKQQLADYATTIHRELGLRHYSCSDFIVQGDEIYFLEVNTLPDLAPTAPFVGAVNAVGASYDEVVAHVVELASR